MNLNKTDTRCRHNEAKYRILSTLYISDCYLRPCQIATITGLSQADTRERLSTMFLQGYIWRRKSFLKGTCGYMYRYLKPMGIRVLNGSTGLEIRMRIRRITGVNISLNRKTQIPRDLWAKFQKTIS